MAKAIACLQPKAGRAEDRIEAGSPVFTGIPDISRPYTTTATPIADEDIATISTVTITAPHAHDATSGVTNQISSHVTARNIPLHRLRDEKNTPPQIPDTFQIQIPPAAIPACGPSSMSVGEITSLVVDRAARYGIDPDFALAVAWTESRFDRVRNSAGGARGTMQLMPATAKRLDVLDACYPVQNIDGGMRHLRALLDEFKNPMIAAAAYNAGERAVRDNDGIPPNSETVRYVASVINHQVGLKERRTARGLDRRVDFDNAANRTLIGVRAPQFVGGVMEF